jgi:outer membrane usher protein
MVRRLLAVAALLLALPIAARAQEQRTFLDIVVNEVPKGDALVVLRGTDALVGVATLTEAGLAGFDGRRETVEGAPFVSLQSLQPRVTFAFNDRDLKLVLSVSPELLPAVVHEMRAGRPADLQYRRDSSLFVNYAVNSTSSKEYDLFTETGATVGGALLYTTVSMSPSGPVRGLSNVTIDQPGSIRRWTFGDAFAGGGGLAGDALVAGVTVSREFALDPYFVRHPTLSVSTPVVTPSVVELHVNGRVVRQEQVQPGRLDLRNLPLTSGHNDAKVVVRDAFGGTQEMSTTYYMTASVLARGVHDYQYSAGLRREALGYSSWAYERPVALARHRVGLTDSVTAGGRVEVAQGLVSAGPSVNLRLPFGEVEGAAAFSRAGNAQGMAALGSYMYAGRLISGGGTVRMMSPRYATLSMTPLSQRPLVETSFFAAIPIRQRVSLSLQHSQATAAAAPTRIRTGIQASTQVFGVADLVVSASRVGDERGRGNEMSVGMTFRFGRRTTLTTSASADREGSRTAIDVQQSLPTATGFGYQLRTETGTPVTSGVLQYQGRYGRYEVRREIVGNLQRSTLSAAGAVVAIGGGVFATRPVRNSFALVKVPGVADVRGFSANQEVGKTNRGGNLLIPDLLPYYGNQLNISDADVPIDYSISKVRLTIAPPYRGGAVALFPVEQVRTISGKVQIFAGGQQRPAKYGQLSVAAGGKEFASPLGSDGRFYFENLPSGRFAATAQYADGTCALTLQVPVSSEPAIELGTVRCVVGDRVGEDGK